MDTIDKKKGNMGYLVEYVGHAYQEPVVTGLITPVTVESCGAKRMTLSYDHNGTRLRAAHSGMSRTAWDPQTPIYATMEDAAKAAEYLCCWMLAHNTARLTKQIEAAKTMNERYHAACKKSLEFVTGTSIKVEVRV